MRRKDHLGIYTEQLSIRLSPQQKQKIISYAKAVNVSVSKLLRDVIMEDTLSLLTISLKLQHLGVIPSARS